MIGPSDFVDIAEKLKITKEEAFRAYMSGIKKLAIIANKLDNADEETYKRYMLVLLWDRIKRLQSLLTKDKTSDIIVRNKKEKGGGR